MASGSAAKLKNREPKAAPALTTLVTAGAPLGVYNPNLDTSISEVEGFNAAGSASMARRMAALSRWREQYDPLVGFSAQRAMLLSQDYTRGWMADLQWTYAFLEATDEDLFALVDRRTSRLLEMDVGAKVEKQADKVLAAEQVAMIEEKLGAIDNLEEAIEHLAMAKFRGYAHAEKWRDYSGDVVHLELVDQWNAVRDGLRGGWKYNPQALQTGYYALSEELVMRPEDFLMYQVGNRHINRIALLKFTSKKLTNVDWDAFAEIYGIPSGVITGPPNMRVDQVAAFSAAAEEISKGGSGFLPYGSLYHKNDFPGGNAPFKERLEYLTEKLVLVGTGGLLTMVARSGSGTLAGNAHADVFEQLAKADARKISAVLDRGLVAEWLEREFPGKKRAARLAIAANEETSTAEVVEHIKTLHDAGLQVDAADASERTGYKLTRVTVTAPAVAAKPGQDKPEPPEDAQAEKIENRRKIINSAGFEAAKGAVFDRNARRMLTAAQLEAVTPLLDRVAALKTTPDAQLAAALERLNSDLPRLQAEARQTAPDVADVWEQILAVALADGLTEPVSAS